MGEYRTVPAGLGEGDVVLVVAGVFRPKPGLIREPRISPSEVASWIGPGDRILSGSFTGFVSPFFPGL